MIVTGSCLCGSVSFKITGKLRPICACHCVQCRKTSGHYVAATQCARADIEIIDDGLRWYRSSETAERGFCERCGSNLFWRRFGNPNISIWAGSLDGDPGVRLETQIHVESKGTYYELPNVTVIAQDVLK